jgi:hypothetical protein
MALVERLCQVDEDPARNIALNDFVEILFRVLDGRHTVQDVKGFYDMTAEDATEMDALVARVTARSTLYERMLAVHQIRSILTFWERRNDLNAPAYDTVQDIRTELNNL